MIRTVLLLTFGAAGSASAHGGHIADVAGHDHWVAGAAIGLAIAVGLWAGLKGRKDRSDTEAETEAEASAEPQES